MKGAIFTIMLAMLMLTLSAGTPVDTTVTSFEIHLKRKSDLPLGFNTCSIDRNYIYSLVVHKLQKKLNGSNFRSLHNPMVLMKFVDVCKKNDHHPGRLSGDDQQQLQKHQYTYFIKICGDLDIDQSLGNATTANFRLKVFVFDANGNLVAKSKSKARNKALSQITINTKDEEHYPLNEEEFFHLITEAADSLELGI